MSKNLLVLKVLTFILLVGTCKSVAIEYENAVFDHTEYPDLRVNAVDDIDEFMQVHPGVHVEELTLQSNVNGRFQFVLGARIANDNLVAHGAKNQSWPRMQNVAVTLTYPQSGLGKQVTYVFIQVDQTSNFGQAYVVKGGLHQRMISIVVEAYNTLILNYDAQIYGI